MNNRLLQWAAVLLLACGIAAAPTTQPATRPVRVRSTALDAVVRESSGLAVSRRHPGTLWTHGDSGNPAALYAVDAETGRVTRTVAVAATNVDWEDIALAPAEDDGPDVLCVADVGNNDRKRATVDVLVLNEPDPRAADQPAPPLRPTRVLKLRYPRETGPFDCEALFVGGGHGYLIEKTLLGGRARLFQFDLSPPGGFQVLRPIGSLPIRLPVTGADLSRDGRTLVVATVAGPRVLSLPAAGPIDWDHVTVKSATYLDPHLEAAALAPDGVAATTEAGRLLLFPWAVFE